MNPSEHFECDRLRLKLTRGACVRMHANSNSACNLPPGGQAIAADERRKTSCKGCLIGAEHARGEAIEPAVEVVRVHAEPKPYVRQDIHTTRISMPKDSKSRVRFRGER